MRVKDIIAGTLGFLDERRKAYQLLFRADMPTSNFVLTDLIDFTHWIDGVPAGATTEELWRLTGRQDVIRRIMQHSGLTSVQLMSLYNGGTVPPIVEQEDDDNG